jgi:hypothetical protein
MTRTVGRDTLIFIDLGMESRLESFAQKYKRTTFTGGSLMLRNAIIVAAALVMATFGAYQAGAQGVTQFNSVQDLPPGELRKSVEKLDPSARAETIRQLNQLAPARADLELLRASPSGKLFYVDPPAPPARKINADSPKVSDIIVNINQAQAFALHSRPGAPRVVYLNFRGENVSGSEWNARTGRTVHPMKAYSEDSNFATFTQAELNTIAEVWKRIAEDFAPFNIDVTTQRPAAFGPNVGHILFSNRRDNNGFDIYENAVGGVAFVDVWGIPDFKRFQPALVFPEGVPGAKNLVEAGTHELGHNLGLSHDGTASLGYYDGHGTGNVSWAPIMGVGYSKNVSQWSKGEYPGASQKQDDIAIITSKLTLRPDDHGQTRTTATPLALTNNGVVTSPTPVTAPGTPLARVNRGVLSTRADVDMFVFTVSNAGRVDLTVHPGWRDAFLATSLRSANLDIRATLIRDNGTPAGVLVTQNNPVNDTFARVQANVTPGRYLLRIEGLGAGNLTTGYSDYGSLGQYFISGKVPLPLLRTLAVSTPIAARGTVSPGGPRPVGTQQTVTATPKPGFSFVRWTKGGVQVATTRSYSFLFNANTSLVAHFVVGAAPPATISVSAAEE